jgi:hypothetical protein
MPTAGPGLLVVGRTVTGFGVVSLECLGLVGLSVSTELQLVNNSFTGLWTAGIWICADGGGAHFIDLNVFRNYWRGIALKDITDSRVTNNTLVGGQSDGLIIYGASVNITVENNRIESNVGADAAALRVGWIADPLVPRANRVVGNRLSRASLAIHVFGAQTTMILNNTINVTGTRTGILVTTATRPLDPGTQPVNTEVVGNQVISDGPCAPQYGCALRLFGVTVPVLAINNDWGLRTVPQVEEVIWHQPDDPLLGLVTFVPFTSMVTLPTPSPTASPTSSSSAASAAAAAATQPRPASTAQPAAAAVAARGPAPSPGAAAQATPSPAPSVVGTAAAATTATATTSAVAAAPPPPSVPAVSRFSVSILDMSQPCIPAAGQRVCDPERLALWNGDGAAWRARFQAQGRPAPSPDEVFNATLAFRIEAGDPAFKAAHAKMLGWPHVRINAARYRGREAAELDEWVEVKNHGGAAQDMSGWSVRLPGTIVAWNFAQGFVLEPGQACKFYVGPPGADPCPGSRNIAAQGVLPNDQGTLELWVDFLDLRADQVTYNADPANQPPPPNLQGFS